MTQPDQISQTKYDRLKAYLIDKVTRQSEGDAAAGEDYQQKVDGWLELTYTKTGLDLNEHLRKKLFYEVRAELIGYGPLQPLLDDSQNSEIMVTGTNQVYVERNGKLVDVPIQFESEAHLMRIIDRMLAPIGRRVDRDTPTANSRLPDGSESILLSPLYLSTGPVLPFANSQSWISTYSK